MPVVGHGQQQAGLSSPRMPAVARAETGGLACDLGTSDTLHGHGPSIMASSARFPTLDQLSTLCT